MEILILIESIIVFIIFIGMFMRLGSIRDALLRMEGATRVKAPPPKPDMEPKNVFCPQCYKTVLTASGKCPDCGHEFTQDVYG